LPTLKLPLLWLSLAFLAGIAVGEATLAWNWSVFHWLILAGAALAWVGARVILHHRGSAAAAPPAHIRIALPVPLPALLLCLSLGAARYQYSLPEINPSYVAWYNDRSEALTLEGVIDTPPDQREAYANLRVRAERIFIQDSQAYTATTGLVLARVEGSSRWQYGDRVQLEGRLQTPPEFEEFSYRDYLNRQGIYAYMPEASARLLAHNQGNPFLAAIYRFRLLCLHITNTIFPEPEASLMAGILLGEEKGIPAATWQAFRDTGTAHIVAISGFNISVLSGVLALLAGKVLGRRRGALAAALGIGLYTILVGAEAPVVRAALMGGVALLGAQLGRQQVGVNSLGFVAVLMTIFNPNILWDVGFQLSFMATLGLVLYAGPLQAGFQRISQPYLPASVLRPVSIAVSEYLLLTLAAQLTTLPVMLYHFRRFSLISVLANPLVLPAQPPAMLMGGLALALGLVYLPFGQAAAWLAWPFPAYTIRMVEAFARVPGGTWSIASVGLPFVLLFYALLFGLTLAPSLGQRIKDTLKPVVLLSILGLAALLVWREALLIPDGRLTLTVMDVGGGEAILVQTPGGRSLLIGGGSSSIRLSDALGRRLPLLHRELDYLVIGGSANEQVAALPAALERFPAHTVLWAGGQGISRGAADLRLALSQSETPLINAQEGQELDLGSGARLKFLAIDRLGGTLLLEWDRFRLLIPIGAYRGMLSRLQENPPHPLTALLLADSGSLERNPLQWLRQLQPQVVLISVAADDRIGRPDQAVMDAITTSTVLRTDRNGWIQLATDGQNLWLEVEKTR
jgi:competence protein ComEC